MRTRTLANVGEVNHISVLNLTVYSAYIQHLQFVDYRAVLLY